MVELLAVNDTKITPTKSSTQKDKTYSLHQKTSGYKAEINQEVYDLITIFDAPTALEETIPKMQLKGYSFSKKAEQKLFNTINVLVQYGVLIATQKKKTEFNPIINSGEKSVKGLNLAIYDLKTLTNSVMLFQDNHPYPENSLHTGSGPV
jgi:hypothetical protein